MKAQIAVDGSAIDGRIASGIVIKDVVKDKIVFEKGLDVTDSTNYENTSCTAECLAVLLAMDIAERLGYTEIEIIYDFEVIYLVITGISNLNAKINREFKKAYDSKKHKFNSITFRKSTAHSRSEDELHRKADEVANNAIRRHL